MTKQITETRTIETEGDEDAETLGKAERDAIKQAFKDAAAKAADIAKRAQAVKESGLEPELYTVLAMELDGIADGLRRLCCKAEYMTRDEDSGPFFMPMAAPRY